MSIITDVAQVTPAWLTSVLRNQGCLPQGCILDLTSEPPRAAGSIVIRLLLRYSPDTPAAAPRRLILKMPRPDALNANAHEVTFYTQIATSMPTPPVLRCYDAQYSDAASRFHLLLEDLSATHRSHPPSMVPASQAHAELIVDALAQIHAFWWGHARLGRDVGTAPTTAALQHALEADSQTFEAFADFLGDRLSRERRRIFERVMADLLPLHAARLTDVRHLTLIHDDPHPGNFLYPDNPALHTLRIIDWKSWQIAHGVSDLAHMMAVFWFPERRARLERLLLQHYQTCLEAHGVTGYAWDTCWHDYRVAVMRYLFYPIWQWSTNHPDSIWWGHLERLLLAFDDLACFELLNG
jgi:Phosphotransferase enzyme family